MKVLVTGSEGFIGRHMVARLMQDGHEVAGMDMKNNPDQDLRRHILSLPIQPDFIVHLASSVSTPGSVHEPLETFENTVVTAANVLEYARRNRIGVHITSSVKARDGMTPYGTAKRMVEAWAHEYRTAYRFPIIINRPGTVYGPGQEGSPESGWIAWFLRAREDGLRVTINGDGHHVRDLLYVTDYCDLVALQIAMPNEFVDRTWDVGGGIANAVEIGAMAKYLGLKHNFGPPRYGDARMYIGENDTPGWRPTTFWKDKIPKGG